MFGPEESIVLGRLSVLRFLHWRARGVHDVRHFTRGIDIMAFVSLCSNGPINHRWDCSGHIGSNWQGAVQQHKTDEDGDGDWIPIGLAITECLFDQALQRGLPK